MSLVPEHPTRRTRSEGGSVSQQEPIVDAKRFGNYLRRVREDRRLSLDAVEELSLGFRERVTKSHLSRIENGRATPTFPRMFTLSQIYGVPVTSLAERFEIELWREIVPVDISGRSAAEIIEQAELLQRSGNYIEVLSMVSAAIERFSREPAPQSLADLRHLRRLQINSLIHLGRYETAKAECEILLASGALEPDERFLSTMAFVTCCYRLKLYTIAQMALEDAEKRLAPREGSGSKRWADLEAHRGMVHGALHQNAEAMACFERAQFLYLSASNPFEATRAQVNLAQLLIDEEQPERALAELKQALEVAEKSGYDRLRALALSHLAVLAFRRRDFTEAASFAMRSNQLAREREYLSLVFRNCFYLWRIALQRNDAAAIRSNEGTLRTYLGRVDAEMPEVSEFRAHTARGEDHESRS
jgi:tetratricopeptide (TPR) repeat protein